MDGDSTRGTSSDSAAASNQVPYASLTDNHLNHASIKCISKLSLPWSL